MRFLLVLILGTMFLPGWSQLTVGGNTKLIIKGEVATAGGFLNRSPDLDLGQAQLIVSGTAGQLNTSAPLSLRALRFDAAGVIPLQGDWRITRSLEFIRGVVEPTGNFLYEGQKTLEGNPESYVSGTFYQRGEGVRFYPVGTEGVYMPMSLNEVGRSSDPIGVRPAASVPLLTLPADVSAVATNRSWEIIPSAAARAVSASLYLPGASVEGQNNLAVVQADNSSGAVADNLKGGPTKDFVTGFLRVSKPILTLGVTAEPDLRIHDLITPYNQDDVNDKLKVVNIEYTFSNKVYLLDRYGVLIKEWTNFRNYDDPDNPAPDNYDFSKLSPGNYICILEYKVSAEGDTGKITQMISVLKDK